MRSFCFLCGYGWGQILMDIKTKSLLKIRNRSAKAPRRLSAAVTKNGTGPQKSFAVFIIRRG